VGKTWLVRDLAERAKYELIELNFERDPGAVRFFGSNDPRRILAELSLVLDRDLSPERHLLFLDEIQAAPEILAKLRWLYEELPELAVVAAGSLLDFSLADHSFSMPVGRISYQHVEPMSFAEFLMAHGQTRLLEALEEWAPGQPLSLASHESATRWFERYAMVGGMPAIVAADASGASSRAVRELQRELIATFRDDFAKYRGRMATELLDSTLLCVAASIGRKFVYTRVRDGVSSHQAKQALERLADARLCHLVRYSSARTPPLGAEVKDKFRKAVLLDVGILHGLLGTPAADAFPSLSALPSSLRGQLLEQLAAQELRSLQSPGGSGPQLFYWQREGGRPGEIDYLLELEGRVIPLELKSGTAGSMKSLHQFMHDKGLDLAVRSDANPPSQMRVNVATTQGQSVSYELLSLPPYLLRRIEALI